MKNDVQGILKLIAKLVFSITFIVIGVVFLYSGDVSKETLGSGFLGTVIGYWIK